MWAATSRFFHATPCAADSEAFKEAVARVRAANTDNATLLNLYALFKQATVGVNDTPKPSMLDFVGKAKWTAWSELGKMRKEDAEKAYIALVNTLVPPPTAVGSIAASSGSCSTLDPPIILNNLSPGGVLTLTLNRPGRLNAFSNDSYRLLGTHLNDAAEDAGVKCVVLTGAGPFHSSGNDMANYGTKPTPALADEMCSAIHFMTEALIAFPKPLVATIKGPAIGVAVTMLGLCDFVFCSHAATFSTPPAAIGLTPVACASYTLPAIMGPALSSEMLFAGRKFTATEARRAKLVAKVVEASEVEFETGRLVVTLASLPQGAVTATKALIRAANMDALRAANDREIKVLRERLLSDECAEAVKRFYERKEQ